MTGRRRDQSGWAWRRARARAIRASVDGCCAICGRPVDLQLQWPHPGSASVDHVIPVSRGGHLTAQENLALVHLQCNMRKGNRDITVETKRAPVVTSRKWL